MRPQEPDPADEHFDIVDARGQPTGRIKRRSDVHRDGDWHRAFHCWIARQTDGGEPSVLFQRRSANKDTFPGHLDVAVGGHFRAGEGFDEVVREIEEELGFAPSKDQLIPIGRRWCEAVTESWVDREIEDVYVHCLTVPVESLRPSYEEITAIDVIAVRDVVALYEEARRTISSQRFVVEPDNSLTAPEIAAVAVDDFIPVSDGYWVAGARAAVAVLNGEQGVTLKLG